VPCPRETECWGSRAGTPACGSSRAGQQYDTSLVLEASGGASDGAFDGYGCSSSSGVCSLVDMNVVIIQRCAVAPWIVPVNRGHFDADRGAFYGSFGEKRLAAFLLFLNMRSVWQSRYAR
jgi:hypothetical protein